MRDLVDRKRTRLDVCSQASANEAAAGKVNTEHQTPVTAFFSLASRAGEQDKTYTQDDEMQ